MTGPSTDPNERRLDRQFRWIERLAPKMRGPLEALRSRRATLIRVPIALALTLGGLLAFLPVLGLWMLPLGLLLLAIDIPVLRPLVGNGLVRARRWISRWARVFGRPRQGRK